LHVLLLGPRFLVLLHPNNPAAHTPPAAAAVDAAFAGDNPVLVFPAGLCSRRGSDGVVRDPRWNKMFVTKSIESGRTVIPIRFGGCNSGFFYNFAKWRARLGIKFNIEMIRLPKEMFRAAGSSFTITIGKPIPPSSLQGGAAAAACAQHIKETVYSL
ncbi:MAG: glycerol acyltransferase, partial [Muribaculaceae bacterium]|nr:glycerol acyltransferase [Muribaculaceae bacterium]